MKSKFAPTVAAVVIIGVGGFMAGRISSPAAVATEKERPETTRAARGLGQDAAAGDAETRKSSRMTRKGGVEKLSAKERLAKLESIIRGENPLARNRALLAFLDELGPGDFEDAVVQFRSLGITESRSGEYALLLTSWALADPVAALAFAEKNTSGGFAQDTVLTSWAAVDPEAAIRWANEKHTGDGPNPYLPGIIRGMAQVDPARATALLAGMPRSEERAKGLDFMLPHLLGKGVAATQNWISGITDDALRSGAILRAARKLADSDPAGTASWLLANPGEAAQRRMDDVYSTWADKDPKAAQSAFSKLPAGESRSNALRGIVSTLANDDPKAALSLMDRYPSDVTDRVVQNFIWRAANSDPGTAASQISRIGNEQRRDQMYRRLLGNWMENDAPSARAWIASNELPATVLERLSRPQTQR